VLATNDAYEKLYPGIRAAESDAVAVLPGRRAVLVDWEGEVSITIAGMRAMMVHFGNPAWGVRLLSEMQDDPDFARLWLERRVQFHRPLDSVIHVHTEAGPVSVSTQFRALPDRADNLHMSIGFPAALQWTAGISRSGIIGFGNRHPSRRSISSFSPPNSGYPSAVPGHRCRGIVKRPVSGIASWGGAPELGQFPGCDPKPLLCY